MMPVPKVMPQILLYWPMRSEVDVCWYGSRSWIFPLHFFFYCTTDGSRASDKMASDMEMGMKQRYVTEFFHLEKMVPTDIHWCLLNVNGDQTVDMTIVKWWWCVSAVVTVTVGHLCWCRFLQAQHARSCLLLAIANGGDYNENRVS